MAPSTRGSTTPRSAIWRSTISRRLCSVGLASCISTGIGLAGGRFPSSIAPQATARRPAHPSQPRLLNAIQPGIDPKSLRRRLYRAKTELPALLRWSAECDG